GRASVPVARIETDAIPLDGYPLCSSLNDGCEIIFGIRPEHVSLANQQTRGPVMEAQPLFIEPMGADTLAWFQHGSQRISARLPPQRAREISGKTSLVLDSSQVSVFDPTTEQQLSPPNRPFGGLDRNKKQGGSRQQTILCASPAKAGVHHSAVR